MKGSNELHINQATIIEAVQEYLDKRYTPTPMVVSVTMESKSAYSGDVFVIKLDQPQDKETPQ